MPVCVAANFKFILQFLFLYSVFFIFFISSTSKMYIQPVHSGQAYRPKWLYEGDGHRWQFARLICLPTTAATWLYTGVKILYIYLICICGYQMNVVFKLV